MKLRLIERKSDGGDVYSWFFKPEEPIAWKAGQYTRYLLPHSNPDDRDESRFFTIASAPFEGFLRISTRFMGDKASSFKKALFAMQADEEIEAWKPMGNFVVDDPSISYCFIAGGIGITPFRSILAQLDHDKAPINVTLVYANHTEEVAFKTELETIRSRHPSFVIEYVTVDQKIDADLIKNRVPDWQNKVFYVSGPEKMAKWVDAVLVGLGIREDKIKNDFFPNYNWP